MKVHSLRERVTSDTAMHANQMRARTHTQQCELQSFLTSVWNARLKVSTRTRAQVPRKFSSKTPGKMSYEDFVWFILSEEDKSTDTSLEYWFK